MEQQTTRSGSASRSTNQAPGHGCELAGVETIPTSTAAAATAADARMGHVTTPSSTSSSTGPFASGDVLDHRLAPRPRRSWDTAFLANVGENGTDTMAASRPRPASGMPASAAAAAVVAEAAAGATAGGSSSGAPGFGPATATQGPIPGGGDVIRSTEAEGMSYRRDGVASSSGGGVPSSWTGKVGLPGTNPNSPDASPSPTLSSSRTGAATASDDDLTDTDESVS